MANPKTAVTKAKINLPVDVNQEMAAEIAALQSRISPPSGDRIQVTQAKTFKMPNGQELRGPLEAIIVEFAAANYYYTEAFDRGNVTLPVCFSLGLEPAGMSPSENAPEPQAASCASCWANQFGSSGRGKACQNARLLALLPLDATEETPLSILKVSPTAIRAFDSHVSAVARQYGVPVRAVVTRIDFSQDTEYATLRFATVEPAAKELVLMAQARKAEAVQRLLTEPDTTSVAEPGNKVIAPPKSRKPAARTTTRR